MDEHHVTISAAAAHLALQILELEKRMDLHMTYQREAVEKASRDLHERLQEMNRFREENRELTQRFATTEALENRILTVMVKVETIEKGITPHLGPRVVALEMAKSNLEGRFWALAAIVVIIEVFMQLWPLLRPH